MMMQEMAFEEIIGLQGPLQQLFLSAGTLLLATCGFLVLALWLPCMLGRTTVNWLVLLGEPYIAFLPNFVHPLLDQIIFPSGNAPSPAYTALQSANATAGEVNLLAIELG